MKLKAFIALLACTCLLLSLYACNGGGEASGSGAGTSSEVESGYIYRSDSVAVVPLKGDETAYYPVIEWIPIELSEVFARDAALSGSVSNIREAKVLYKSDGEEKEGQITLFDLTVKSILFSEKGSVNVGDTVTVALDYNMTMHSSELPVITKGEDCLVFLDLSSGITQKYPSFPELEKYSDYYAYAPHELLFEKVGEGYISGKLFGEALDAAPIYELLRLEESKFDRLKTNAADGNIEELRAAARSNLPHSSVLERAGCEAVGNLFLRMHKRGNITNLSKKTYIIEATALEDYIRAEANKR